MSEQLRYIGYLRTTPTDRDLGVQANALKQAGCTDLFAATEPLTTTAACKQLLDLLHNGDELIVYHLDSLVRDEYALVNLQQQLKAMSVTLVVCEDQETMGGSHA